jgi:hypothetical protein
MLDKYKYIFTNFTLYNTTHRHKVGTRSAIMGDNSSVMKVKEDWQRCSFQSQHQQIFSDYMLY